MSKEGKGTRFRRTVNRPADSVIRVVIRDVQDKTRIRIDSDQVCEIVVDFAISENLPKKCTTDIAVDDKGSTIKP